MNLKLVNTKDGSVTFLDGDKNEYYHSINGAITESRRVFIEAGLLYIAQRKHKINILEVSFGTGLNAYLTYLESLAGKFHVDYTALEPYPLSSQLIKQLNYAVHDSDTVFVHMHETKDSVGEDLGSYFTFRKFSLPLQEYLSKKAFDLICFDAFAPDVQPEMWTLQIFQRLHTMMNDEAALVTYCAKGSVKRDLRHT